MPKAVQSGKIQKTSKFQYSPSKVNLALDAIADGMAVSKASKVFRVPRTTLRNKVSGKSPKASTGQCGFYSFLGEDTEKILVNWILDCAKMGFPIDKDGLLTSVQKLVTQLNIKTPFPNNRPGKKWYYGFLKRHKELSAKKPEYIHGGRGAVTEEKIRHWFDEIYKTLEEMNAADVLNDPERVFNMDETCFPLAPKSGNILGPRGRHVYDERTSSDKENVTTLFTVNASGQFAPPLTLFKYDRIPKTIVQSAPKGWGLGKSENGWMTAECFFEYFSNVFLDHLKKMEIQFPIIVFLDGHTSHLTLHLSKFCREHQIILIALVPNATHILQPLDVAVFGPIKKKWQKISRKFKIDNQGQEISKGNLPSILSDIINDPKMRENIKSGFRTAGLYPFNVNNVDFSKIILRKPESEKNQILESSAEAVSHLKYLEQKIDPVLLNEFQKTKRRNHEWEGRPEALLLFKLCIDISKEIEDHAKDVRVNDIDYSSDNDLRSRTPTQLKETLVPNSPNILLTETAEASFALYEDEKDNDISNQQPSTSRILTNGSEAAKIESVKRKMVTEFSPMSKSALKNILPYPGERKTKKSVKKQSTPCSVLTSDTWLYLEEEKARVKAENEKAKLERKRIKEQKKIKAEEEKLEKKARKNTTRKNNLKFMDQDTSSSEEEWKESGSSGDDIDFPEVVTPEVEILQPAQLKIGHFILVKFAGTGKRMSTTYRYVATILKVLPNREYQIQCLKSLDKEKTRFDYIENDISMVNVNDIIALLPEPVVEQEGRKLVTKFVGTIDVFEKY